MNKDIKILVVDDFATMRRIVKNLLRDLGFKNTKEADDGATALPMLLAGGYDFLITDINMPKMSGIDLTKALRTDDKLKAIPVLIVTSDAKRKALVEAAGAGVNGYIVKPFTTEILNAKIEKIFARIDERGA